MKEKKEQLKKIIGSAFAISHKDVKHVIDGDEKTVDELLNDDSMLSMISTLINAKSHLATTKKSSPLNVLCRANSPEVEVDKAATIIPSDIIMITHDTLVEFHESLFEIDTQTIDWSTTLSTWNNFQSNFDGQTLDYTLISEAIVETMILNMESLSDDFTHIASNDTPWKSKHSEISKVTG